MKCLLNAFLAAILPWILVTACQSSGEGEAPKSYPTQVSEEGPIVEVKTEFPGGASFLEVRSNIQSEEDLVEYREQKREEALEILTLLEGKGEGARDLPVVFTFTSPLSREALARKVEDHELPLVGSLRFVSTRGGGEIPYEMLNSPEVTDLEGRLKERLREDNGIQDFRLFEGFTAMKGVIPREKISPALDDPQIFVVDLGPKEIYEDDRTRASWGDVAYAVSRFLKNR